MFLMSKGSCSQTSQLMAISHAMSSEGAMTMVWKEPAIFLPPGPTKRPGRRITQALGLTGGALRDPGSFAIAFGEVRQSNPKKPRIKSPIEISHKGFQFQVPEF